MTPQEKIASGLQPTLKPDPQSQDPQFKRIPASTANLLLPKAADQLEHEHRAAHEYHKKNVELLHDILQRGAQETADDSQTTAWRSTCKYLLKDRLYALSPTHNPREIARLRGDPNKVAYFGLKHPVPVISSYSLGNEASDPGILLIDPGSVQSGSVGFRKPNTGEVAIVDPMMHSNNASEREVFVKNTIKQLVPELAEAKDVPATGKPETTG